MNKLEVNFYLYRWNTSLGCAPGRKFFSPEKGLKFPINWHSRQSLLISETSAAKNTMNQRERAIISHRSALAQEKLVASTFYGRGSQTLKWINITREILLNCSHLGNLSFCVSMRFQVIPVLWVSQPHFEQQDWRTFYKRAKATLEIT